VTRNNFGPAATRRSTARPRRGGSLWTGLIAGILIGILAAAVVAWFLSRSKSENTKAEQLDEVLPPPKSGSKPQPKPPSLKILPAPTVTAPPAPKVLPAPPRPAAPADPASQAPVRALPPPIDYNYDKIFLGGSLKPRAAARPQDQWWLQVAALKNEDDARRLRAKLLLLNLDAVVQRADVGNVLLYRVRVDPFSREEDSYASLEILSQNNYTPRALKETVLP
jgi:cell division protein FtsN